MALASSSRNGARIIWVALHTAEGSRRRSDLYNFFDTVRSGSSHGAADGTGLDDGWVSDDRAAWTLLNGNPVSLNLEMCGFARWTRTQWLSTGTVDGVVNPRQMVRNAAEWARRKCEKYGIPKTHIGVDGVRARRAGIIMHRDYTYGAGDGDHTDIGNNFPWDVFFADMAGMPQEEDDVSAEEVWFGKKIGYPGDKYTDYPGVWVPSIDKHVSTLRFTEMPALRALLGQVLSAVTNDKDITPDAVRQIVDDATAKAAREQAALIVAQINSGIAALVEDALERVQAGDNAAEVEELLRRIGSLANTNPTT